MEEVRNIFQSKKRKPKAKTIGTTLSSNTSKGKKKKRKYFKHVIGCFSGPEATFNLSRQDWENLYAVGLGKAWKGQEEACIPGHVTPKEFHALLVSMFPALVSTPYELCRLGGAYNNELKVIESCDVPDLALFRPFWSPESLRPLVGKAQLFIRPQRSILEKAKEIKIPKVRTL